MFQKLKAAWGKWRANRRQYAIDRALDKAERSKHGDDHIGMPPTTPGQ